MIPHGVLVLAEPFPGLQAERVAGALASGLRMGERALTVEEICAGKQTGAGGELVESQSPREWWGGGDRIQRMRAARAIVIATPRLDERTLAGSLAFEVATSARQAGVPAYAVTAENALNSFEARMLDLQVILQAHTVRGLKAAGRRLEEMV